ncbi:MAG TPA: 5'-nucleotidase C-terminal domain-containing protein [Candidatus Gastranaerophilales bacterium]|nr:5'-nucleotidase C-terminal domain-containing protein [Candidatus Gastranaerophilales bacterium]
MRLNIYNHTTCLSFQKKSDKNNEPVETNIFYVNDLHGKIKPLEPLLLASAKFSEEHAGKDSFKLAAGDLKVGGNEKLNKLIMLWMELMGFDLCALGNHELDGGVARFSSQLKNIDALSKKYLNKPVSYKYIVSNLDAPKNSPLLEQYKDKMFNLSENREDKKLVKSCVIERNGHKYGFVGLTPIKLEKKIYGIEDKELINSLDKENTIKELQKEIDNFPKEVNKIILVSHAGYWSEKEIAEKTSGIDVIIGGHSHDIIHGSRFLKSKTEEPVLIVQAGRNGNLFGNLKVNFDKNGIIDRSKTANHVFNTYSVSLNNPQFNKYNDLRQKLNEIKDDKNILGPKQKLGYLEDDYRAVSRRNCENPMTSFYADAITAYSSKKGVNANAVLLINNHDFIHEFLHKGAIYDRNLINISAFRSKLFIAELSGADIKKILEFGAKSSVYKKLEKGFKKSEKHKPGLIQGNIKYTANPLSENNKIIDIKMPKPNGGFENLDENKKYNVIFDDYLIKSFHYREGDKKHQIALPIIEKAQKTPLSWDKEDALIDYIKSFNGKPFKIEGKNRINDLTKPIGINYSLADQEELLCQ